MAEAGGQRSGQALGNFFIQYKRTVALEDYEEDLRQRLEDRDQAHAWIQAKLQVTFLWKRTGALEGG